jgi:hypothetical protein
MTDKPRFELELTLSRLTSHVKVDPTLISDKWLDQAWNMMNEFMMDMLDELEPDITDEEYRARFIEVCYRLIYREMFTLHVMPHWEKADLERLGTKKRGPGGPNRKKGSYDDTWN